MSEFGWIDTYFRPLAEARKEALSLRDDAALLSLPTGMQLAITTDMLNEGVHFLPATPPHLIAQKALRVNLSDLAAMGATAYAYSLALALPRGTDEAWIADFTSGLAQDQQAFGCILIGGDTTASHGPLGVSITAYGHVPVGKALTRSGAQQGDDLYVSGTIGDGWLGLRMAQGHLHAQDITVMRYHLPEPRLTLGKALQGHASACMDISDGLLQDLAHLCRASGMAAALDASQIPLSHAAHQLMGEGRIHLADLLGGGDDYELLFAAPPSARGYLEGWGNLSRIGTLREGSGITLYDAHGDVIPIQMTGWQHF